MGQSYRSTCGRTTLALNRLLFARCTNNRMNAVSQIQTLSRPATNLLYGRAQDFSFVIRSSETQTVSGKPHSNV
jgi:hypothetical protein